MPSSRFTADSDCSSPQTNRLREPRHKRLLGARPASQQGAPRRSGSGGTTIADVRSRAVFSVRLRIGQADTPQQFPNPAPGFLSVPGVDLRCKRAPTLHRPEPRSSSLIYGVLSIPPRSPKGLSPTASARVAPASRLRASTSTPLAKPPQHIATVPIA